MKFTLKGVVFLFCILSLSSISFAGVHEVSASLEGTPMNAYYSIIGSGVTVDDGQAYVWVETQGDCYWTYRPRCNNSPYPPDGAWRDCYDEPHMDCRYQTGYFKLPSEDVVWDGAKRLKFVRDGRYLTIAKRHGFPLFVSYKLKSNTAVAVSDLLTEVKLIIKTDESVEP